MELNRQTQFLIACRYVPYDQWFLTHIDKSWKIKHLKQSIIAKALNLPFDRRRLIQTPANARPSSPITFAPDDSIRSTSPIEFAAPPTRRRRDGPTACPPGLEDDGNEFSTAPESKEADLEDRQIAIPGNAGARVAVNPGSLASSPSSPSTVKPGHPVPPGAVAVPTFLEENDQIFTDVFTLIRFTTGQILEDNFFVSWYDIGPHELVELHASSPPTTFSLAIVFHQLLVNGGTIDVDLSSLSISDQLRTFKIPHHHNSLSSALNLSSGPEHPSSKSASTSVPKNDKVATKLTLGLCNPPVLTYLPRHDPVTYAQPYWEGWIRVLRVVLRSNVDLVSASHVSGVTARTKEGGLGKSSRAQDPLSNASEYNLRRTEDECNENRYQTKKEWRERWAVIRDGFLNLCRDRNDMTPTHRFPLSALANLTGAEHLATHVHKNRPRACTQSEPGKVGGTGKSHRPSSSGQSTGRSVSKNTTKTAAVNNRPSSSRRGPDTIYPKGPSTPLTGISPAKSDLSLQLSTPFAYPMNPFPGVEPSTVKEASLPGSPPRHITSSYSSVDVLHKNNHGLSRHQRDKFDRERAALRELERETERKAKEEALRMKKEVESIMRWDDIGLFGKNKGKDGKARMKDNRRRGDPSTHKDLGERDRKALDYSASSPGRHPFGDKVTDKKDRDHVRQRDGGADRYQDPRRGKDLTSERGLRSHDDRSYIPSSPEDARLAGMWIVCAKFTNVDKGIELETAAASTPVSGEGGRYTRTGPSLASDSQVDHIDEAVEKEDKDENTKDRDWRRFERDRKEAASKSQAIISADISSLVVAPRKSSLPSLGLGLTMLNAGNHGNAPSNTLFGGLFGSKDKEKDGPDRRREQKQKMKGKDRETGDKVKDHWDDEFPDTTAMESSITGDGSQGDSNQGSSQLCVQDQVETTSDALKDRLSIDTLAASHSDPEYPGLPSPSFAPNSDSDVEETVQDHRRRHDHGHSDQRNTEQRLPKQTAIEGDKSEWIVLDLGTDFAYNSFLRILHRHFISPIQTAFIDSSELQFSDFEQDGFESAPDHDARSHNTPVALPYPEWRNEVVHRARSEGMLECGRPVELTLHNLGKQPQDIRPAFRKQRVRDEQRRKQIRMGFLRGQAKTKFDAPVPDVLYQGQSSLLPSNIVDESQEFIEDEFTGRKDVNDPNGFETLAFDDTDDESEDESACWWKDIPRQLHLQERKNKRETDHKITSEFKDQIVAAQAFPAIPFSNPFSSGLEASESSMTSSTVLFEDRQLSESTSTTTLASNLTSSSSAYSAPLTASHHHSTFPFSNSFTADNAFLNSRSLILTTPREERQRYFERGGLELHTETSPITAALQQDGDNEGSGSGPPMYHLGHRRMSSSIHGLASLPRAISSPSSQESLISQSHGEAQTRSFSADETVGSNIIASTLRRPSSITNLHSSSSTPTTKASSPRPILTPAQIHQIETEIEAQIAAAANQPIIGSSPPRAADLKSKPAISYAWPVIEYGPDSRLPNKWMRGNGGSPWGYNDVGLGSRHALDLDREDGSPRTRLTPSSPFNRSRKSSHTTSPSRPTTTVLRRVRSGSSLQIPMAIHFEDVEENEA